MSSKLPGIEESIRILSEKASLGVLVLQDDQIVLANETLARIQGCDSPSELIGRDVFSLGHFSKSEFEKVHRNSKLGLNHGKTFCWEGIGIGGREFRIEGRPIKITWYGRPAVFTISFDLGSPEGNSSQASETRRVHLRDGNTDPLPCRIIGRSTVMEALFKKISIVAQVDHTVLILGESGSGKELVAKAIHDCSKRRDRNFVAVNSTAINEHLFESEFFGHRKGAFSGAFCDKIGFFDAAEGGTLFLDEIGDLSKDAQAKLLRAIDTGEYTPVGRTLPKKSTARIIVATNLDPMKLVESGVMREDFFYRIYNLVIDVPPLKDRLDDIPLLVKHFHERLDPKRTLEGLPEKMIKAFSHYHWPGNVRELQNVVARYITFGQVEAFPETPSACLQNSSEETEQQGLGQVSLKSAVETLEKKMITQALLQFAGNQSKAMVHLGVPKRSFIRKVRKYGLR